jgi:hypothetical protein
MGEERKTVKSKTETFFRDVVLYGIPNKLQKLATIKVNFFYVQTFHISCVYI